MTSSGLFCGACGAESTPTAKFCSQCGTRLTQATQSAEYKQVTVLFADVVGSMKLAAVLQTERLRDIMNELFNRAAAVVQRYQGTVDKFTGDGLMALFGAPVALEDHALRACISAIEIQSVARKFAGEVLRRDGLRLQLRVGLNSGEVIAGEIGSGPGRYTAVGHPVGMAQRMESARTGRRCAVFDVHGARWWTGAARLAGRKCRDQGGRRAGTRAPPAGGGVGARRSWVATKVRWWAAMPTSGRLQRSFDTGQQPSESAVVGAPGLGKSRLIA